MEISEKEIIRFRFDDPRQYEIYKEIKELIGPGPASFFRDACWIMQNCNVLESSSHLVGHLVREIESALRSILRPVAFTGNDVCSDQHKDEIRNILRSFSITEDASEAQAWFKLSESLHWIAHRKGLVAPRPLGEVEDIWESIQILLSVILRHIRDQFLRWLPVLDELLSKSQPTKNEVNRFANEIPNNTIFHCYFFDHLENLGWLEPLWNKGFFMKPPSAERNEEAGTIRFPPWPESRYLARMAKHRPEIVADIIRKMQDTDNAAVHSDLIDALLTMPPEVSATLTEKVKEWAKSPYLLLPEKLGKLITHLTEGGRVCEAMAISSILLDVFPDSRQERLPEPQSRLDAWHYEQILKQNFLDLVRIVGLPAVELLCNLLEKAIILSSKQKEYKEPEDYSCIWRPAIENHDQNQNLGRTIKDVLVSGVRDAAIMAVSSDKVAVEEVIEMLESRSWKVFNRIALHVLAVFAEQALPLAAKRLTDYKLFDDVHLQHEYTILLQKCFGQLSQQEQRIILRWIETGPDVEEFKKWRQAETGVSPTEREIAHYQAIWRRDWLARIGEYNLPDERRKRYEELVSEFGEPDHPEFPVYSNGGWVGPVSPKSADELRAMSVEDIVKFLQIWTPPENLFDEPTPEGLGRTLTSVVAEDPQRFAKKAEEFRKLDPTYVRALLYGLRASLGKGCIFDWDPVLELCQWIVSQPREISKRQVRRFEADPDWGWTRKTIAWLLEIGFGQIHGCIPIIFREKAWTILKSLTEDPEPSLADEQYNSFSMNPDDLSFNTTRGAAMHAVICYALWVRRHLEREANEERYAHMNFEKMLEVREVLDAHLDVAYDPSLAIRTVYGKWFPWLISLDTDWARKNTMCIFPLEEEDRIYFEAAWNTYIAFNQPDESVFELLQEQYKHAIDLIDTQRSEIRWLVDPDRRLAEHLMVFYWWGTIELDDPLLFKFWEKAPDELRGHAIEFIGHALQRGEKPVPIDILKRFQKLWEGRLAKAMESPESHINEISAFGWWFISRKFDSNWSISQLAKVLELIPKINPDDMVLEHLASIVETYPAESVKCLRKIAEGDQEGWTIDMGREHIRHILKVSLQYENVRKEAKELVHYLGSRGFLEFKDLLINCEREDQT